MQPAETDPIQILGHAAWGTGPDYTAAAQKHRRQLQTRRRCAPRRLYQSVPWANWYQTWSHVRRGVQSNAGRGSGAAFLPFYFLGAGCRGAPADDLVALLDKNGTNDFLPGLLDSMKTKNGYAGVPWSMDLRVLWYRKSLLEKAGADVPTDWKSYVEAGAKLKKIGVTGLGLAAGSQTTDAQHTVSALMINNGGGFFAPDGTVACVTDRNIETLEFFKELVSAGVIDPYAASYTSDNLAGDWKSGRVGMGFGQTGLDKTFPPMRRPTWSSLIPSRGRMATRARSITSTRSGCSKPRRPRPHPRPSSPTI